MINRKKLSFRHLLTISVAALLAATHSFAIPKAPCDQPAEVCCKNAQDGYAFSYPKDIGLACPSDFYFYGDFLWMQAQEEGLEYAQVALDSSNNLGEYHGFSAGNHDWDYNPGARATIGGYFDHDHWLVEASYTYLHIAEDNASHENNLNQIALWLPYQSVAAYTYTSARWKANYNTFDLILGKPYHISRYFVSNPFIGIRGAWIEQDYLARYSSDGTTSSDMVADNDYWGVGLRAGMDGEYLFTKKLSLFGKLAGSLLFGKFDVTQKWTGASYLGSNYHQEYFTNLPNLELRLGGAWSHYLFNKNYRMTVKIAYEFHYWWHQNNLKRLFGTIDTSSQDTVSRGDLSLNGFAFGLLFDF